jgi:hypothetical protein
MARLNARPAPWWLAAWTWRALVWPALSAILSATLWGIWRGLWVAWSRPAWAPMAAGKLLASLVVSSPLSQAQAGTTPPPLPPPGGAPPSPSPPPSRIRSRQIALNITEREWLVIETLNRFRMATGEQIQRLHFAHLHGKDSARKARINTLKRLRDARVVMSFPRRIAGHSRGSVPHIWALDKVGWRLIRQRSGLPEGERFRRPHRPGMLLEMHVIAVAEFYVRVVEASRRDAFTIAEFAAEPACWWRDSSGMLLKPDAYLALRGPGYIDHWWIEVDLDTEHMPAIERQISAYLAFARRGEPGPNDSLPGVLFVAKTPKRCVELKRTVSRIGPVAEDYITVTTMDAATAVLTSRLFGQQ